MKTNVELPGISLSRRLRKQACRELCLCPLCGTLNSALNTECVVCGWFGTFVQDEQLVADALVRVMQELGLEPKRRSLVERLVGFFRRLSGRGVDLRV